MTAPDLPYPDTVTFVETSVDGYGNDVVESQVEVNCIVELNTGFAHASNQDAITADAVVRPDPVDSFIQANFNRLEGMLVRIPLYGDADADAWYKIESVTTYRPTLLDFNTRENIECLLKKTREIQGVS